MLIAIVGSSKNRSKGCKEKNEREKEKNKVLWMLGEGEHQNPMGSKPYADVAALPESRLKV